MAAVKSWTPVGSQASEIIWNGIMDGRSVSDFSIEHILSPQLGSKPQVRRFSTDGYLRGIPGGFSLESVSFRPPAPVPVPVSAPVPGCLQYRGMRFGEAFYPCGAAFHHTDLSGIYPNCGVYKHLGPESADAQPLAAYNAYHPAGGPAQCRQKARIRTVFTDSQTKQLEALFELTDYPAIEARAELARSTGLSEETIRVWFKNRRARRKRQRGGSKGRSSRPSSPGASAEKKLFTSLL
ncbi:dharma [Odontesthes bonariensis]|uniref:dharma n=1 Tax=Odontesthes bonariensis TaxID=219752 RepID=UPI003F587956